MTLAKAMLNHPKLLLLDEPTASIDPATARDIRAHIVAAAKADGCGVLWTSHNMYEVAEVCHRVMFLARGRILLQGEPDALIREHGVANLEDLFVSVAHESLAEAAQSPGGPRRMNLARVYAIVLRQVYLLRGSPVRLLPMIAWVAIDIVLWGFISRYPRQHRRPAVQLHPPPSWARC
ncbi:MAG: hypothetical protein WDN45_03335 [Caulobacteraceae bacterium]